MKKLMLPLLVLSLAGFASAADWPQWRGPNRDDVSKETGLLQTWPKDGPKLLWTFKDAGIGYSAPAIIGDTLYSMGADDKTEYMYALDLNTQTKKWSTAHRLGVLVSTTATARAARRPWTATSSTASAARAT